MKYSEIQDFMEQRSSFEKTNSEETKLHYALKRVGERIVSALKPINKRISLKSADINIDFASEDEKGNLLTKDGQYSYTKENTKKRNQAISDLQDEIDSTEIVIEPYIVETYPTLTDSQQKAFSGIVIPKIEK